MLNAVLVGMEFNELLPVFERPEFTEKYEGFNHIFLFNGTVEEASMVYIIRDHDREKFAAKKALMLKAVAFMNEKYGAGTIDLTLTDQYYNMKEKVEPYPEIMAVAQEAIEAIGLAFIYGTADTQYFHWRALWAREIRIYSRVCLGEGG